MKEIVITFLVIACGISHAQVDPSINQNISIAEWPEISFETKPWTRWWWHGSAVTKEGITFEMEAFQKAGLGGVEITPIYGVYGHEDKFVNFLSPLWMDLLAHTLKEGKRLGLGVDMATGTGWPFGGPWVEAEDACKNIRLKRYDLEGGQRLNEKIEFIQGPYLRAVKNQIYQVHDDPTSTDIAAGTTKEPARQATQPLAIKDLVEPIAANKELQALALEQVQFEKPLALQSLMAYGPAGQVVDLTSKVDTHGILNWTAAPGKWKLYALFQGWHGKMVERAGPGGEGNVIDHFSATALTHYLSKFDSAFQKYDISSLRAFFNDSYEVDDARGTADWTPKLLEEFEKRRGYDLRRHLPALFNDDIEKEKNQRVLCDYRETISELLLENFTKPWKAWASNKNAFTRNQAHGSPSNILDLYSVVDIPEIEGTEPLRIKMASSAANVMGKNLASAEAATWLNEHFDSNLADIKVALDRFMINGINHLVYHGTAYSPADEAWPGWLFYAAVHLNQRNPLWQDFHALNAYVARCQSFLQNTSPDNDVLLYYPVYDRFSAPGSEMIEHFDGIGKQFEGTSFERSAKWMLEKGYSFDYISDRQIQNLTFRNGNLLTEGAASYKTIVIPHCQFIPVKTLQKLVKLSEEGASIIFFEGMPETFSGYSGLQEDSIEFRMLKDKIVKNLKKNVKEGVGLDRLLSGTTCRKESMVAKGLLYCRKKDKEGAAIYLVNNQTDSTFSGWIQLQSKARAVLIYDPMTGVSGKALIKTVSPQHVVQVYVQLTPRQTLILKATDHGVDQKPYPFYQLTNNRIPLNGKWHVRFVSGGPQLPEPVITDTLISWTNFTGDGYDAFSGSAIYEFKFPQPSAGHWLLDLGTVDESVEIFLNDKSLGTLICPPYALMIPSSSFKKENELKIRVSNLMMNRIVSMDKKKVFWKKFYNVNFPARRPENRENGIFNATNIAPRSSGLLGPVQLISAKIVNK
jgi:hypothetical protein